VPCRRVAIEERKGKKNRVGSDRPPLRKTTVYKVVADLTIQAEKECVARVDHGHLRRYIVLSKKERRKKGGGAERDVAVLDKPILHSPRENSSSTSARRGRKDKEKGETDLRVLETVHSSARPPSSFMTRGA